MLLGYADVPKVVALGSFAGLIASLWLTSAAAGAIAKPRTPAVSGPFKARRWISGAAAGLLLTATVSSLFSASPRSSLTGAVPGYDATDLYSLTAYVLLAAAAARFLQSRRHLESAAWAMATAGGVASIYAISQALGFDPFHLNAPRAAVNPPASSFGNALSAGSYLTVSLFLSLGLFLLRSDPKSTRGLIAAGLVLMQAVGLGVVASDGAWTAIGAGGATFAVLAWLSVIAGQGADFWRRFGRHMSAIPVILVLAVSAGAAIEAVGPDGEMPDPTQRAFSTLTHSAERPDLDSARSSALEAIRARPSVGGESPNALVLHVFGYGPDSYRYVHPLVAEAEDAGDTVKHAGNSYLNIAVEFGVAGLIAWTVLNVAVLMAGIRSARDRAAHSWVRLLAVATTSAFVAHAVDQMTSPSNAPDSLAMWTLVAMIAAVVAVRRPGAEASKKAGQKGLRQGRHSIVWPLVFAPPLALGLIVVVLIATFSTNPGYLAADHAAARLRIDVESGTEVATILETAGDAARLAPDVGLYHSVEAEAYELAAAESETGSPVRRLLLQKALEARTRAGELSPLSAQSAFELGQALERLGRYDGAIQQFERAIELSPRYWRNWLELARAHAGVDQTEPGMAALRQAERLLQQQTAEVRNQAEHEFQEVRRSLAEEN